MGQEQGRGCRKGTTPGFRTLVLWLNEWVILDYLLTHFLCMYISEKSLLGEEELISLFRTETRTLSPNNLISLENSEEIPGK